MPGVFSNYEEFLKIYTSPILTKKTNIHVMELRNHGSSPSTYNANHLIMGQDIVKQIIKFSINYLYFFLYSKIKRLITLMPKVYKMLFCWVTGSFINYNYKYHQCIFN